MNAIQVQQCMASQAEGVHQAESEISEGVSRYSLSVSEVAPRVVGADGRAIAHCGNSRTVGGFNISGVHRSGYRRYERGTRQIVIKCTLEAMPVPQCDESFISTTFEAGKGLRDQALRLIDFLKVGGQVTPIEVK